jgi:class 3 adenylate cyclase
VLFDPTATGRRTEDYPWAPSPEEWRARLREVRAGWGRTEFLEDMLARWAPTKAEDPEFHRWFVGHMRRGLSPGSALAFFRMMMDSDVSDVLPAVRVPTVVLSSPAERGPGEFFARRIRGARLVELPNDVGIYHWVDPEAYDIAMRETRELVERVGRPAPPTRVLSTVLFTDLVGSTEQASALGDRAWRELLERHHAAIRRRLGEHRGEEVDTAGDGVLATFDGPGRAIECACSIREDLRRLGLEVRAGIHTGECEVADGKVAGLAVHVGARIVERAGPGEVLVSGTVKDLVAGSGLGFEDRGVRELKGVPGEWRLYAVST